MKKLNFKLFTLIILAFTSCIATKKGYQSSPVISRNVNLDDIKADIKVNETAKIKGQSTSSYFLMFRVSGDNSFADGISFSTDASASYFQKLNPLKIISSGRLNKVRGAAAHKALNTTTIENYLFFKKYVVEVEGYGAKYENFRTEKQKIVILENGKELLLQDK
jgi:hypothetical protein